MHSVPLLVLLAGLSSIAWSQGTLPACAQHCYAENISIGGCGAADAKCICTNTALIDKLSCCVLQHCDAADTAATEQYSQNLCAVFGVTNLPKVASCPGVTTAPSSGPATITDQLTRPTQNPGPIIETSLNSKQSAILASLASKESAMTATTETTTTGTTKSAAATTTPTQTAAGAGATTSSHTGGAAVITVAPAAGVGLAGALALGAFAFL